MQDFVCRPPYFHTFEVTPAISVFIAAISLDRQRLAYSDGYSVE